MDKQSVEYVLMKAFCTFRHVNKDDIPYGDIGFSEESFSKAIRAAMAYERENLINGFLRCAFGYDAPNVAIEQIVEKMK